VSMDAVIGKWIIYAAIGDGVRRLVLCCRPNNDG